MELKKILGYIIIAIGFLIVVVAATADLTGLGEAPGFGLWQVGGVIGGVVVMVVGVLLAVRKRVGG